MKRSKFNLTHTHSTTADAGQLIPFLLQPTLPGDRFRIGLKNFIRCQPMVAPLMHEVYFYTQYWYVPYRILWDNWEDFITGGNNLQANPAFPQVTAPSGGWKTGSLADYFGFPTKQTGIKVSAMPFRAYAEIWNTRYRDEDLQSEVAISYDDGGDNTTNTDILSPSWKRDYFTLARPYTQRGADILVPILGTEDKQTTYHKHTGFYNLTNLQYRHWWSNYPSQENQFSNVQELIEFLGPIASNYVVEMIKDLVITVPAGGVVVSSWYAGNVAVPAGTYTYSDSDNTYFLFFLFMTRVLETNFLEGLRKAPTILTDAQEFVEQQLSLSSITRDAFFTVPSFSVNFSSSGLGTSVIFENYKFEFHSNLQTDETVSVPGSNSVIPTPSLAITSESAGFVYFDFGESAHQLQSFSYTYYATLSSSGNFSVRDLRASSALQRYAERSLKFGNRYEEFIQREFGVKPRDSRIQRPEYLGGGRGILNISEVLQTAEGTDTSVGTMRGHGIASVAQRPIRFKSPEHGIIIGLLSIRPKAVYTQGIEREFLKRSRLDFFTPELANIGMQEVLTQELFANSSNVNDIFGYSDRYQEYRYHKPLVTGEFREKLNYWNMARIFENAPKLNDEFINMEYSNEVFKRPFAVQDESYHSFLIMLENVIHAWRPVPKRAKDILK